MAYAGPASAPPGGPARQPDQQPDRHHQGGAEQEVAPQPADGVESHITDFADQLFDAVKKVPRIEPDRGENNPAHDRQQHQPPQHRERRTAEEAADHIVCHGIVIPPLHSGHFSTSPAAILRACRCGAPSPPSLPRSSKASSASSRSASRGCLSQRSRLMRGNRIAMPDLCLVERCRPSNATSNTKPRSLACTTSRTGPKRLTVLLRTNLSSSASSSSVKPK